VEVAKLGFLDPLTSLVLSFVFLGVLVYRRVSLGVTLTLTALLLSVLSIDIGDVYEVLLKTSTERITILLVLVTFGIMLLSQLYKETNLINVLSESLSRMAKNPKLVVSVLPAIIGLLPVAGGALMSAPMIESEAEKIKLDENAKAYVNVWFRHTIFPVYPMSQIIILASALTGVSLASLIIRQLPVVIVMVAVGYAIGLWKAPSAHSSNLVGSKTTFTSNLKSFTKSFSPIFIMIFVMAVFKIDVSIAAFVGVIVLLLITRPGFKVFLKPFKSKSLYEVTLAAYGAMLLRNATVASGVTGVLGDLASNGVVSSFALLLILPSVLGFLLGSPSGGIALSVPILAGTLSFTPKTAGLLYIAAYLGYLGAPTHLCLALTADYFKSPLGKVYKYLVPSLAVSFAASILVYFLL